jgi:hypothetical protein
MEAGVRLCELDEFASFTDNLRPKNYTTFTQAFGNPIHGSDERY